MDGWSEKFNIEYSSLHTRQQDTTRITAHHATRREQHITPDYTLHTTQHPQTERWAGGRTGGRTDAPYGQRRADTDRRTEKMDITGPIWTAIDRDRHADRDGPIRTDTVTKTNELVGTQT